MISWSKFRAEQRVLAVEKDIQKVEREFSILFDSEDFRKQFEDYVNKRMPDLFSMRLFCKNYGEWNK